MPTCASNGGGICRGKPTLLSSHDTTCGFWIDLKLYPGVQAIPNYFSVLGLSNKLALTRLNAGSFWTKHTRPAHFLSYLDCLNVFVHSTYEIAAVP